MKARYTRVIVAAAALACALAACTHDTTPPGTVQLPNPGRCTPVDVAAAPETAPLLGPIAQQFNDSPAARLSPQECVFVRVAQVDSSAATDQLVAGWPDPETQGPAPAVWAPASSVWVSLANERRGAAHLDAIATGGSSFARTPLVVAMPVPMAHALGWPAKDISWRDLARLAREPHPWNAYGHPEWGTFRLGKADPAVSTSALLETMAVGALGDTTAATLEASVRHYGDAAWPFLSNWQRLDGHRSEYTYLSAVVTDERAVTAYNKGSANGVVPGRDEHPKKPKVPLAAVVPSGASLEADNPLVVVNAPWVTGAGRDGGRAFVNYALTPVVQRTVVAAGFRPGGAPARLGQPAYSAVSNALDSWSAIRKRARMLILFDVSDSMGDPADPTLPNGPTKIDRAKSALIAALDRLSPEDEVGLRIFTTHVTTGPSSSWQDIVPIGTLAKQRSVLTRAIASLEPRQGSPLYTATRDAYDAMAANIDPARINGVLLLTDGFNEDDANNDRKALLAHLRDNVQFVTIGYSGEADMSTLTFIAWTTNARVYDATNTSTIDEILPAAMTNF